MPTNFWLPNQDGQIVYKKNGISLSHLSLWTPARKASLISSIFASKYLLQTSQSFNLYKESYLKLKLLKNPRNDELIILHQQTTYWTKKKYNYDAGFSLKISPFFTFDGNLSESITIFQGLKLRNQLIS